MNKPHIIIIEGCDKTGKSTLSFTLMEKFGYEKYEHLGRPPEGISMWDYHQEVLQRVKSHGKPTVIDRFHLSNLVYGQLMEHDQLTLDEVKKIEDELRELNTSIIFCWRDPKKIEDAFFYDKEEMIQPKMIEPIIKEYWYQLYHTDIPYITYNFDVDGPMSKRILANALEPTYE